MPDILCNTQDIPEGTCKSFALTTYDKPLELFVVHFSGQFFAYENHCPHTGVNLNWQENQFLDISGERIQCATHGALFRISDGLCEWGPCLGKHLRPLSVKAVDSQLILAND